jgi:ATP-binding cassette subfamily F protein uup
MATLLSARDLSRVLPSRPLFEGVSIHIDEGDRIGLIGPNGGGKSTLLRMLAGIEASDGGEIVRRRGLRVAFVAQQDRFAPDATLRSAVVDTLPAAERDAAAGRLDAETRAEIALSRLGFDDPNGSAATLSGGWRKRLSLACGLAAEPDLLLLDEPTNHLDLAGVGWLESFLREAASAVVFVTHDRWFIERTAGRVIELSEAYPGGTFEAEGDYSAFLRRREAFIEAQRSTASSLANAVRRDVAWMQQGVQARRTRNQSQVDAAAERRAALDTLRQRNAAPQQAASIDFTATQRRTRRLLRLAGVGKAIAGRRLFHGVDLELGPGDRIGLLGPNGCGKTTLLRVVSGDLAPDEGRVDRAEGLRTIVFSQHRATLDPTATLQEALCPVGDHVEWQGKSVHVSGWAKRFLFKASQLPTPVAALSGGEQARVLIANLMLQPADLLILDEPTNDLDVPSLEVLEAALVEFTGAILLVSHDRFMLERVSTECFGFDPEGCIRRYFDPQAWLDAWAAAEAAATPIGRAPREASREPVPAAPARPRAPRKLAYHEQRELDGIEAAILAAESEVARLQQSTSDPVLLADHARSAAAFGALAAATAQVERLYARWSELESKQQGG